MVSNTSRNGGDNMIGLNRRRISNAKSEPFVIPYITDGLVFYLDGIEKGSTQGAWTDLVGGIVFSPYTDGVTFNADNVEFSGSRNTALISNVDGSTDYLPTNDSATIEICYNNTSGNLNVALFYGGNYNKALSFQIRNTTEVSFSTKNSGVPYMGLHTNQAKTTYSISRERVYENCIEQSFSTNKGYMTGNFSKIIVGGSGRGASTIYDIFNGRIYSIRIYNRQLTEAEVLSNQRIDNTRFNLGLTVN